MGYLEDILPLDLPLVDSSIIKVIGVGGGGGNAVNHMYRQGIKDVTFVVCNTDNQALISSPVPTKIQLGSIITQGLGAGGKPEVACQAAEESILEIQKMLSDNTKMVFITAGMGGGTGTGASPVVAKAAHDMGILTVGIVTIPFAFEGNLKIRQALDGVAALSDHVDAILVINNEKLKKIYPDLALSNAFAKADDVLTNAAKAIAEIITVPGYINTDFADVFSIMKDGKVAIMNTGYASGDNRITKAIEDALTSPLLNTNDVSGAKKILLSLYCSKTHQIRMEEVEQIQEFMVTVGENVQVIWGASFDDTLDDHVKITLIATGFDVSNIPGMPEKAEKPIYKAPKQTSSEPVVIHSAESAMTHETQLDNDSQEIELELNPDELKEALTEKAINVYYGTGEKVIEIIEEEPDYVTITLEDLEDEQTRKIIEDQPAWKRKMNK